MSSVRALAVSLTLVAGALLPVAASAPQACAASANSAALVVDTGGSATAYCVELPSGSVNGIDLIKLASKQYGLTYNLGFGGKAVCALDGVGVTDSGDCFEKMPDYWGYWLGSGSGGWNWSSVGAASISVGPGDIQGWSWGSGKDGSSHPAPPNTDYSDVCRVKDTSGGGGTKDGGSGSGSNGGGGSGTGGTGGSNGTGAGTGGQDAGNGSATGGSGTGSGDRTSAEPDPSSAPDARPNAGRSPAERDGASTGTITAADGAPTEASPSAVVLAAPLANGSGGAGGGAPVGALLAVAAALALAGAGFRKLYAAPRGKHRAGHVAPKG